MDLDTMKNELRASESTNKVQSNTHQYYQVLKRRFVIETAVAAFALMAVIMMLLFGDKLMTLILTEFAIQHSIKGSGQLNFLMYFSFFVSAAYCITVPIKMWRSISPDESLSWTLTDRVKSEINRLEKQNTFWNKAPIWSFLPANIIGISFFWGLQYSLLGTWLPSLYLIMYFILLIAMNLGGFWLKHHLIEKEIKPLVTELREVELTLKQMGA
jgi:hypothetical protein